MLKRLFRETIYRMFCLFPIDKRLITFESINGNNFDCNVRAIYDVMAEKKLGYRLKIFLNKGVQIESSYDKDVVIKGTVVWLYYTARSRVWIKNTGSYGGLKKRKGQIYYQTWHGIPLKRMGLSQVNQSDEEIDCNYVSDWDYVLSPSKYFEKCLNDAFGKALNYLRLGYPRSDKFYNYDKSLIIETKKELGIPVNSKVIFYAPTFRDADKSGDSEINARISKMSVPKGFVLLIRVHPRIKLGIQESGEVINVSDYPSINKLLIIADVLVTDYSSVLFDYLNLRKPMIFFAYDLYNYEMRERGFYLDYKSLPGPITQTVDELNQELANLGSYWKRFGKKRDKFYKDFCPLEDGYASKRVVDHVIKTIKEVNEN